MKAISTACRRLVNESEKTGPGPKRKEIGHDHPRTHR